MTETKNIVWHDSVITKQDRTKQNNHKSPVLWFTGLSGSGKSTITVELEKALFEEGIRSYRLDGDNIRHGLNNNLGFSPEDRKENIRRIGEVAKLLNDAGLITLTAFISPYQEDRDKVRELLADGEFVEVYVKCSLESCEARDPKGLYQKARSGEIKGFTGIDAPYEEPTSPELVIDTENSSVEEAVEEIINYLKGQQYI
ncbi:adenylyl-sulfate kinase [Gracilibacillus sp. S3-1-1]|uniref:Adenylyl-sulfate kinase n=1 Tax=Gracilibacillus pellucidus TaxID=3095368 RepID=A0ACC6M2Q9_9BACI|nr:adenylyl-sulfate kinase [Gracilibacillus sp. S3-1-1]MDX8045231.1 adenylyl-sulfate kinase [Gracilibacillus sp. S3-1-1]